MDQSSSCFKDITEGKGAEESRMRGIIEITVVTNFQRNYERIYPTSYSLSDVVGVLAMQICSPYHIA